MPVHSFTLGRCRLEWQASASIRLPDYAGSILRDAGVRRGLADHLLKVGGDATAGRDLIVGRTGFVGNLLRKGCAMIRAFFLSYYNRPRLAHGKEMQ